MSAVSCFYPLPNVIKLSKKQERYEDTGSHILWCVGSDVPIEPHTVSYLNDIDPLPCPFSPIVPHFLRPLDRLFSGSLTLPYDT